MENNNLKSLQTQYNNLEAQLKVKRQEFENAKEIISKLQSQRDKVRNEIMNIENSDEIVISEHAIIRYLERVKQFDISAIKKDILSDEVVSMVKTLGRTGKYPNGNFRLVIKNGIVTTVTI